MVLVPIGMCRIFFLWGGARSLKTLFLKIFMSKKLYSRPNKIPKFSKSMLGIETDWLSLQAHRQHQNEDRKSGPQGGGTWLWFTPPSPPVRQLGFLSVLRIRNFCLDPDLAKNMKEQINKNFISHFRTRDTFCSSRRRDVCHFFNLCSTAPPRKFFS